MVVTSHNVYDNYMVLLSCSRSLLFFRTKLNLSHCWSDERALSMSGNTKGTMIGIKLNNNK